MNLKVTLHNLKWCTRLGKFLRNAVMLSALRMLRTSRKMLRWSGGRCSWCGKNCGFNSSISKKGLRCIGCEDKI